MWVEQPSPRKFFNDKYYKNEDPSSAGLKELAFVSNINGFDLILRFTDNSLANQFNRDLVELNANFVETNFFDATTEHVDHKYRCFDDYQHSSITDLFIHLNSHTEIELTKLSKFLQNSFSIPDEVMAIINAASRPLTDLEKIFYELLQFFTKENFSELLDIATKISSIEPENCNISLWELAIKCKDLKLLDEWIDTLTHINDNSDHLYTTAQTELAYYYLSKLSEIEKQNLDKQETIRLFKEGIKCAIQISDDQESAEILKKFMLTFLGINWVEQPKIFPSLDNDTKDEVPVNMITGLLVYTQSLQKQVLSLQQQQQPDDSHTHKKPSPGF